MYKNIRISMVAIFHDAVTDNESRQYYNFEWNLDADFISELKRFIEKNIVPDVKESEYAYIAFESGTTFAYITVPGHTIEFG